MRQRDALTELIVAKVGATKEGKMSTRQFALRAVDPDTGWSPSKSLVGKIIQGLGYDVTPQLVSAVAVGLGVSREVVAAAAHFQVIGFVESELEGDAPARLLHQLGLNLSDLPKSRAVADRWESEGVGNVQSVDIRDPEG
ncbi:hypothetical protein [Streptomyces sp. NPDC047315]|uniref:hypothetical protein n=1 Tax=Streptomyces sp. NPDC047315 TaxID=3155142 RepID=UPI0033DD3F2D